MKPDLELPRLSLRLNRFLLAGVLLTGSLLGCSRPAHDLWRVAVGDGEAERGRPVTPVSFWSPLSLDGEAAEGVRILARFSGRAPGDMAVGSFVIRSPRGLRNLVAGIGLEAGSLLRPGRTLVVGIVSDAASDEGLLRVDGIEVKGEKVVVRCMREDGAGAGTGRWFSLVEIPLTRRTIVFAPPPPRARTGKDVGGPAPPPFLSDTL